MKKIITVLFMVATVGLVGCGQSGELYIPEPPQQDEQSQ